MKITKVVIIIAVLLAIPFTLKVKGQDYGQHQSLFTDIKAHKVGDILTVIVSERNRATSQVTNKTEKTTKGEASGGPGIGTFRLFPMFQADMKSKTTFDGKGQNLRSKTLEAKLSVTVVNVKPNGDLIIEGTRTINVSGEKETITLTGIVRQKDISRDNTIDSYLIADAVIQNTGKGSSETSTRPGIFMRFLQWLF